MNLRLDWCSYEAAKYAVEHWHYSRCMPQGGLVKIGVWENDSFIGVVIFGRGATNELGSPYGLKNIEVCELVRVALKKHENPVSRIMSIAIKLLKNTNKGLRLVVSFADSNEGHHGGIYQATNWIYSGITETSKFPVINGKTVYPRVLSHLVRQGKVKDRKDVPHVVKKGKHRYLFPLDELMSKKIQKLSKPYPKRAGSKDNVVSANHAGEGGASPTPALQPTAEVNL